MWPGVVDVGPFFGTNPGKKQLAHVPWVTRPVHIKRAKVFGEHKTMPYSSRFCGGGTSAIRKLRSDDRRRFNPCQGSELNSWPARTRRAVPATPQGKPTQAPFRTALLPCRRLTHPTSRTTLQETTARSEVQSSPARREPPPVPRGPACSPRRHARNEWCLRYR